MNTTFNEKKATEKLIKKCRIYLLDNFHKFSRPNKIKVSLALLQKAIPTQLEHSGEIKGLENQTRVIIIYANKPAEVNSNPESRIPAA